MACQIKNHYMNKLCILILFMSLLFSGCCTNKTVSDFVKTDVEL